MKRKLIIFRRLTVSGIQNFFRNSWLSIAATAVMIVALTIILGAILVNVTARNAIKELSKDIKVSIYFQDGVAEAQRDKLMTTLKENKAVVLILF